MGSLAVLRDVMQDPSSRSQHDHCEHRHDEEALPSSYVVPGRFAVDVGPAVSQNRLGPDQGLAASPEPQNPHGWSAW